MNLTTTFFSPKNVDMIKNYPVQVSLDIHDKNTYLFALDVRSGEILADYNIPGTFKKVLKKILKFGKDVSGSIMLIYEAGNAGFAPYRYFTKHGMEVKVIAPSSIPRKSKFQKTDKTDTHHNLNCHLSGFLRYVYIPELADESLRECLRYRFQTVHTITKEKQKIHGLIKRHGLVFEGTKSYWTKSHYKWLQTVGLPLPIRKVMDMRLSHLMTTEQELKGLDEVLDSAISKNHHYKRLQSVYECIPGIGRIGSMTLILEGGDLKRFYSPGALMSFIGVIPGKLSSGGNDPALRITKAGNKYLRTIFVAAAKVYGDNRILELFSKVVFQKIKKEIYPECIFKLSNKT